MPTLTRFAVILSIVLVFGVAFAFDPSWLRGHFFAAPTSVKASPRVQDARKVQILVELTDAPTVEVYDRALSGARMTRAEAEKIATQVSQAQQRLIETEQGRVAGILKSQFEAVELYRVQKSVNAIAVTVRADALDDIRKLAGVKRVSMLSNEEATSRQGNSVQQGNASQTGRTQTPARDTTDTVTAELPQVAGPEIPVSPATQAARAQQVQVLVELQDAAAARIYAETIKKSGLSEKQARSIAATATRGHMNVIRAAQDRVGSTMRGGRINAQEIYRAQKAFNGIAIRVSADQIDEIKRIPGVKDVHPIELEFPITSTSVPFIGAPSVWGNTLGLPQGYTGAGIKIGIIDTGIDYQHANFGGTGLLADYQLNNRTIITDTIGGNPIFPTAKVVGGYDFAGDAYNGGNVPVPDPDPMDCYGHGTHVAGIAAGYGVKSDGTTYTGPFDGTAPFSSLRIGPGAAPQAKLYALRIFGCSGSTGLTVQAIDWAIDPNNDSDFSDHLDVINMSLGSNDGQLSSTSTIAAENASLAGVIVAAASGNAGDTYFITSAPANSNRAISVAASSDDGNPGVVLTVNSPAGIAGNYAASASNSFAPTPAPNPSGQTANIVLALDAANGSGPLTTDGCTALTNAAAIAGNIALIDRGTCGFQVKANNAEAAGAIAVIIANNAVGDPNFLLLGATGSTPVTIPTLFISLADRNTFVANSPVNATLNSANAGDTIGSFSSRGPRSGWPNVLKPDIAGPGVSITSAQTGVVCNGTTTTGCLVSNASGFIAGSQSLTISGTSMATPHIAGVMALLKQEHPDWTVEELKALVMNTALHDTTLGANGGGIKYGLGRIGAGRVDAALAAQSNVVAFNADDAGLVSLSFPGEIVGTQTIVKKLRLVNKGLTPVTYDLGIDTIIDAPGVSYSLPGGNSVTVPAESSLTIDVQMNANANLMNHTREASIAPTQAAPSPLTSLGNVARHWLTEEASYLTLSVAGTTKLRVPLYASLRPASMMSGPTKIVTGGAPTGSTTISLGGQDVCTGTLGAGPLCSGTFPTTEESLVTPFELQVVHPRNISIPAEANIKYAGVSYNGSVLMFGVASHGDWSTPRQVSYNIYIDNNKDGVWDRILFASDPGSMARNIFGNSSATGQDTFLTGTFNLATNGVSTQQFINRLSSAVVDSAVYNNNVMFLAATPASLGISGSFKYKVVTCPGNQPLCGPLGGFTLDEASGPYYYDYTAQGLNFSGVSLADDLNGSTLSVGWNTANMATNGSLGALLLHHHNAGGKRDQVIPLDTAQSADLAIVKSMSPTNPTFGQNVVFTLTVTNAGPNNATGVVVTDVLPNGLGYVSDDGAGAYSTATGTWNVGNVANGGSATLHITAKVNSTDSMDNTATITSSSPLDPNPSNNYSKVTIMAPRVADLTASMSVSSPTVLVGGSVTYTLTVTNNGGDPAYSINVPEMFPAFPTLTPTSYTVSQGAFNPATGIWNFASLGKGASATLTYTVTAPNTAGALKSQATATSNVSDPNNADNTASATTTVLSPATITGTKTVSGSFQPSGAVTYSVVLSNSSSYDQQDNPGNEFTDVLPSGLTLVSANASAGTALATLATNTVTWNGVIPGNGSVTITINATVNSGTGGQTISNQGSISFDKDGNGTNEASDVTDDPGTPAAKDATSFLVVTPPTVTPVAVVATAGSAASSQILGTATDQLDASNLLVASVNGGATATVNGVTISNLSIASNGQVTAKVGASCTATSAMFTLKVTNTHNASTSITLNVTVNPNTGPTLAYPASVTVGLNQSPTINPTAGPSDNGSVSTIVVDSVDAAFTGTVNVDNTTGVISITNAGPTGMHSVTIKATDNCGTTTKVTVQIEVILFKVGISDPIVCIGDNNTLSVHAEVANPNNVPAQMNFTAPILAPLSGIPGACVSSAGTCTVTSNLVTVTGVIAANQLVTIDYKVKVANGTPQGTNLCITSSVSLDNGVPAMVTACGVLNCPGRTRAIVSDQKPGSILVFPYYSSGAGSDTRLTLTNISTAGATAQNPNYTFVHLMFIDGSTCQQADQYVCLTPGASLTVKASEYDPGTTGWVLAVAVDAQGLPTKNNVLIGNAFVSDTTYQDNYGAETFSANGNVLAAINGNTATLFLDGSSYDAVPNQLAIEFQSPVDANGQKVVTVGLNGIVGSAMTGAAQVGTGLVINASEKPSGSFAGFLGNGCQATGNINGSNPRVTLGLSKMIPAGQSGTMSFNIGSGVGLIFTPKASKFGGIRTLHKLTFVPTQITIPVFVPSC